MTETVEKSDKNQPPMAAIDGSRVRQLREEKKLTQLYVASVVGVTTDTISRWENNRYPSIKRENAEKLAIALESELADILRNDAGILPETSAAAPPKRTFHLYIIVIAMVVLAAIGGYILLQRDTPAKSERQLPNFAPPGSVIPVRIKLTLNKTGSRGIIVREKLPPGWRMLKALPHSSGEGVGGEAKWLIPAGSGQVTISYSVQVPTDAPLGSKALFTGEIKAGGEGDGRTTVVRGGNRVTVAPYHWADRNGDGRIDDSEIMPAYYLTDELKDFGLDWPTIEAIWGGKGYRWTPQKGFEIMTK